MKQNYEWITRRRIALLNEVIFPKLFFLQFFKLTILYLYGRWTFLEIEIHTTVTTAQQNKKLFYIFLKLSNIILIITVTFGGLFPSYFTRMFFSSTEPTISLWLKVCISIGMWNHPEWSVLSLTQIDTTLIFYSTDSNENMLLSLSLQQHGNPI